MKAATRALIGCAILSLGTPSFAIQNAPVVISKQKPAGAFLPEGTAVPLRTLEEITSRDAKVGDRFKLEVSEDVVLGGHVVIPAGSPAVGEITKVVGKGMFGKSGKLETRLLYVKLGDQQVKIGGKKGDRGSGGTAATVGALLFVWPAAFFITGKSAVISPGTQAMGYLEADLPVVFEDGTAPAPPPVVVKAAAVPVPAAAPAEPAATPASAPAAAAAAPLAKAETCAQWAERMAPHNPGTAKSMQKQCEAKTR
ncbi:MAG TPA: hypothetical protein VNT25_05090 [Allosphingosinicella sp.]|nr:hypothetical protein [Allosphingosinicella sp.]